MVPERPLRRQRRRTRQPGVLREDVRRGRSRQDEDVKNTSLRDPVGGRLLRGGTADIYPSLRADRVENAYSRLGRVRLHERNRAIERHSRVCKVFEDVCVVQAVGLRIVSVLADSGGEGETRGVLRDTIDVTMIGEINIKRKRLGP